MSDDRILLGGKGFVPVGDSTIERDMFFLGALRLAGLERIEIEAAESPEQFARRLLSQLAASGKTFELLGALIVPEGTSGDDWRPELAVETGRFIARLTAPDDKQRVNGLIVSLLIDFFVEGLSSLESIRRSSEEAAPADEPPSPSPGTSATASGALSSATSQEETTMPPGA